MGFYYKSGDFAGSDTITAAELEAQPGKFGYINFPNELRFSGNKMLVPVSVEIERKGFGVCVRVESVKGGGFKSEFLDFDTYHWTIQRPSGPTIAVKEIKVGRRTHKQWGDALRYVSVSRMPTNSKGFIYRHQIDEQGTTHLGAGIEKKRGDGLVPIRRGKDSRYEVELARGNWTELKVVDR